MIVTSLSDYYFKLVSLVNYFGVKRKLAQLEDYSLGTNTQRRGDSHDGAADTEDDPNHRRAESHPADSAQEHEEENCSVCMLPVLYQGKVLACNHIFHEQCLLIWVYKNDNGACPLCKNEIFPGPDSEGLFADSGLKEGANFEQELQNIVSSHLKDHDKEAIKSYVRAVAAHHSVGPQIPDDETDQILSRVVAGLTKHEASLSSKVQGNSNIFEEPQFGFKSPLDLRWRSRRIVTLETDNIVSSAWSAGTISQAASRINQIPSDNMSTRLSRTYLEVLQNFDLVFASLKEMWANSPGLNPAPPAETTNPNANTNN